MSSQSGRWVVLILGAAVLGTLALQITRAGDITPTESALFSVLQFVFSLAFAWLLARVSLREEFLKSQRGFAIAAYRRIMGIERAVNRLLRRASSLILDDESQGAVVREIAVGLKDSINASIADWGDVIGDEIEIIERIERLRAQRAATEWRTDEPSDEESATEEDYDALLERLPSSLRIASESNADPADFVEKFCEEQVRLQGNVRFDVYVDDDFDVDWNELEPDEELDVRIGDGNRTRTAALIAFRRNGQRAGVLLNFTGVYPYKEFMLAFVEWLGRSEFVVRVLDETSHFPEHYRAELVSAHRERVIE